MTKEKHIDDAQPLTVDEHFHALITDDNPIVSDLMKVTFDNLPSWYDEKLFEEGRLYYKRNMLGTSTSNLLGLMSILAIPPVLKVLLFTKQGNTTCSAYRRYVSTFLHIHFLYISDQNDSGSKFYKTLNVIRTKHSIAIKRFGEKNLGCIYQRDMAVSMFAFIGFMSLYPEDFAFTNDKKGREGWNHVWRVLGHMIGINDRLNICRKNAAETTELCRRIRSEILAKYLKDAPPEFFKMVGNMLNGVWYADIFVHADSCFAGLHHYLGVEYDKPRNWHAVLIGSFGTFRLFLTTLPVIGTVMRMYHYYASCVQHWCLQHFPILAWIKFGKLQTRIQLYPNMK